VLVNHGAAASLPRGLFDCYKASPAASHLCFAGGVARKRDAGLLGCVAPRACIFLVEFYEVLTLPPRSAVCLPAGGVARERATRTAGRFVLFCGWFPPLMISFPSCHAFWLAALHESEMQEPLRMCCSWGVHFFILS
jgi:hypothetical protein